MDVKTKISLDILKNSIPPQIFAKQNDRLTRFAEISLYANGTPFDIPSETLIIIRYKKSDGTVGLYDTDEKGNAAYVINGNLVTITLAEQMLTVCDEVACELNLYNDKGQRLTSFSFVVNIAQSVVTDKQIISSNYYNVLTSQIAAVLLAESNAVLSASNAAKSEEQAKISETIANESKILSIENATTATEKANIAKHCEENAALSASSAESSALVAADNSSKASNSQSLCESSALSALESKSAAATSASKAEDSAKAAAESAAKSTGIKILNGVLPNDKGEATLTADDVKALPQDGTSVNSAKLGDKLPTYYQPKTDRGLNTTTKSIVGGINQVFENSIQQYSHYKSESKQELIGNGTNGKFKAIESDDVYFFTINNVTYPVKCGEETYISLIKNNWYTFIFDGEFVNFNQGGAALNFKIICGTAQPTNPKENTLWVNTNVEIPSNGYIFQNTEPMGNHVNGTVWIKTGIFEKLSFNALKKGKLILSLTNVYQYLDNKFVVKKSKIYQNNEWQELYKWFYNHGTGYMGGYKNSPTIYHTLETNRIAITRISDSIENGVTSVSSFDFTPFKALHAVVMTPVGQVSGAALGFTSSPTGTLTQYTHKATSGKEELLSLDVSNVNSYQYIAMNTTGGAYTTAYFYEVYGEYL